MSALTAPLSLNGPVNSPLLRTQPHAIGGADAARQRRPLLGICQWFHYHDYRSVERAVDLLRELGVTHLRTGVSWADFHRPHGRAWYRWQMEALAEFDVLLSVWHTPPSLAEGRCCAGPPRRLQDYADFLWLLLEEFGDCIADVELWNEPNNRLKWAFDRFDPTWRKFSDMVGMAARTVRLHGISSGVPRRAVLGGMVPVDPAWLETVAEHGGLDEVDVVAIHGFPEMWWPDRPNWDWYRDWHGWPDKVALVGPQAADRPVWITETGLATWDFNQHREGRHDLQALMLTRAACAPVDRVYWYSLIDLDPLRAAIEGFHVDENEYHLGLVRYDGSKKPAWDHFADLVRAAGLGENDRAAACLEG